MIAAIALFLLIGMSTVYYGYCGVYIRWFKTARHRKPEKAGKGVSLMIPVCGLDVGAFKNWVSLCRQGYETYEVLFCVLSRHDPAVPILEKIVDRFRSGSLGSNAHRVELHFRPEALGTNHQVNNLMHLLKYAEHEYVVFADSDIRVTPEYLSKVTASLSDPAVGVVTCGYLDHSPKSMGAALASYGRCIDFIPGVLLARRLDANLKFAIGPTIATRKSVLARIGGLESLLNRIGSDYHIGKMAADAGYRVELSEYVLDNDCGGERLRDVFLRELRWARTIRLNRGIQYYGMAICHGTVYCIPFLWLSGFQGWAVWLCLVTSLIRLVQALVCIESLSCPKLLWWLWLLPIRDVMSFAVWLGGAFGRSVYWRGRWLQIQPSGILVE